MPGKPALLRELNERTVYQTIRDQHPVSRAEVARLTGLSKPTVSLALRTLEASRLVTPCGRGEPAPGRAALLYEPVSDAALGIGVAVDVDRVQAGLVDLDGTIVDRVEEPIGRRAADRSAARVFDAVAACVDRLVPPRTPTRRRLASVVVATPGVIDPRSGVLTQAGILPGLDGTVPAVELSARCGIDVSVVNDVDAAALAEQAHGHGRNRQHLAVVWVGSGLGAALILGGVLHTGARGGAGEIIDVPFLAARGSDEQIDPSLAGFAQLVRSLEGDHPRLRRHRKDPVGVLDAALADATWAVALVDRLAERIAWYAAAVVAVVDPELVVLAGVIGAHPALTAPVQHHLGQLLTAAPRVVASTLGPEPVLSGAASLASRQAITVAFDRRDLARPA
jgi:predicted NBD/HSP70 family sugar kinase